MAGEAYDAGRVRRGARPSRSDVACALWALGLSLLLLGQALGPGYVLSYDMVWVHDLALRPDFLGLGSGLPRAVPSDAVVAVLDELVPGAVLQKLVLLGALVGAGLGVARLLVDRPLVARLVGTGLAVWNPFTVERLVLGQWPVLLGLAVLPWVVDAVRAWRADGRLPARLLWLVPLGSLSASAGVATALVLLVLAAGARRWPGVVAVVVAANAPWVLAGLLHAGSATSDPLGARVFALHSEGSVPGPLAALTLGGVWNSEVVPGSRTGFTGWVALVVLVGLAAVGLRTWRRCTAASSRRESWGLPVLWALGWGLGVLSWTAPGALGDLAAHVPGGGVVRDGSRLLCLCVPLLVLLVADGTAVVWRHLPRQALAPVVGAALVLVPVALLPDAALGAGGRLHAVAYPASYDAARGAVARWAQRHEGDVLVLPPSSYRQPGWNRGAKVLDPTGRVLTPDYVASDVLVVSGRVLAGEDPRFEAAVRALGAPDAGGRAAALAQLGIGVVVVDTTAPGTSPDVAGTLLLDAAPLRVTALGGVEPTSPRASWVAVMSIAWTALVGLLVASVVVGAGRAARRRHADVC